MPHANVKPASPTSHMQKTRIDAARAIYDLPFNELLFRAHTVHRQYFKQNEIQLCRLLSIKTGGCPEDCGYCSQSAHHQTGLKAEKLMSIEMIAAAAKNAKLAGATRFCMGAAWRHLKDRDVERIVSIIHEVKSLGLETCMTLGMLTEEQALTLHAAGLDYYNHNIDTSEAYYPNIVTTHTFIDRLNTLSRVRQAGIKVCAGGILGMGETIDDRISMLTTLANLDVPPESIPINLLIPIPGTKLAKQQNVNPLDFVRMIALARILMPTSWIRLSAGRSTMSDETQALCFFVGANSIFIGDKLLTAENPDESKDGLLFQRLGLHAVSVNDYAC